MKFNPTHIFLLLLGCIHLHGFSQPFRYIRGNEQDRDSIKEHNIKSFFEYESSFDNPTEKTLTKIVSYDRNGNLIRKWIVDPKTNAQNQWTYIYSPTNQLLEEATYFPDSLTISQCNSHFYDTVGNEIMTIYENYSKGKLVHFSKVVNQYEKNQLIDTKKFNDKGILLQHYSFVYNQFGQRIEEITYDKDDQPKYHNKINPFQQDGEPIGFPMETDSTIENLLKETIIFLNDGTKLVEDGYAIRTFSKDGILLKWVEKNYKIHWFVYTFYE